MANWNIKKKNGENVKFDDNSVRSNTEYKDADNNRNSNSFFQDSHTNRIFLNDHLIYEEYGYNNQQNRILVNRIPELQNQENRDRNLFNCGLLVLFILFPPGLIMYLILRLFKMI